MTPAPRRASAAAPSIRSWDALGPVAQSLVQELTPEGVAQVAVEQAQRVFVTRGPLAAGPSLIALWLLEPDADELRLLAQRGYSPESEVELRVVSLNATSATAAAARTARPVEVADFHATGDDLAFGRRIAAREGARSVYAEPLIARDRVVGVLSVVPGRRDEPRAFTRRERGLVRAFGGLCAIAVENARLHAHAIRRAASAQESSEQRGEFMSVAAHELRTPITSLKGYAQLLRRDLDRAPADLDRLRRGLGMIDQQAGRLAELIDRLLDVARLESGKVELEREPTDLRRLVDEMVDAARRETTAHDLVVRGPACVRLAVDRPRVAQVLANLLDNAIKYSPNGGPIEVDLVERPHAVALSVRDYGIGIPPERRPHVFDRFYQAHPERRMGGLGIGLYVCRQIALMHGGQIEAELPEGGGTRVVVTLPRDAGDCPLPTSRGSTTDPLPRQADT